MKKVLLSLCLGSALLVSPIAFSQDASEASVKELISKTGGAAMGNMMIDQMTAQFKQMGLPEDVIKSIKDEIKVDELITELVPVYQKNFNEAEIKEIITFYDSPAGKKLVEKMPQIMQDTQPVAQKWGMKVGQKIQAKMQEKK